MLGGSTPPARMDPGPGAAPLPREKSSAEVREQEAQECVGGLRNPNCHVSRNSALRKVGRRVRRVLDDFVDRHPQMIDMGMQLGKGIDTDFAEAEVDEFRRDFAKEFDIKAPDQLDGYWQELFKVLIEISEDVDIDIPIRCRLAQCSIHDL